MTTTSKVYQKQWIEANKEYLKLYRKGYRLKQKQNLRGLTPQQKAYFMWWLMGYSQAEISKIMNISTTRCQQLEKRVGRTFFDVAVKQVRDQIEELIGLE